MLYISDGFLTSAVIYEVNTVTDDVINVGDIDNHTALPVRNEEKGLFCFVFFFKTSIASTFTFNLINNIGNQYAYGLIF